MIRKRSIRDRERLDYEAREAAKMLRLEAIGCMVRQEHEKAEARNRLAERLERALDGKPTGFDHFGGRGEWLKQQEKQDAA